MITIDGRKLIIFLIVILIAVFGYLYIGSATHAQWNGGPTIIRQSEPRAEANTVFLIQNVPGTGPKYQIYNSIKYENQDPQHQSDKSTRDAGSIKEMTDSVNKVLDQIEASGPRCNGTDSIVLRLTDGSADLVYWCGINVNGAQKYIVTTYNSKDSDNKNTQPLKTCTSFKEWRTEVKKGLDVMARQQ